MANLETAHAGGAKLLQERYEPVSTRPARTELCATDPPLVLTHIPLLKVPAGAVNVHGYLHRFAGPTDRHVNVVRFEHTDYAPVGLTYVQPCGAGEVRHALV